MWPSATSGGSRLAWTFDCPGVHSVRQTTCVRRFVRRAIAELCSIRIVVRLTLLTYGARTRKHCLDRARYRWLCGILGPVCGMPLCAGQSVRGPGTNTLSPSMSCLVNVPSCVAAGSNLAPHPETVFSCIPLLLPIGSDRHVGAVSTRHSRWFLHAPSIAGARAACPYLPYILRLFRGRGTVWRG